MLKMSHAGMDRLKSTMDLVADKLAGKALDKDALQALKHSMPPVALAAVKADLRRFCREAQALLQGAGPTIAGLKKRVEASEAFQSKVASMQPQLCSDEKTEEACGVYVKDLVFCFELADELPKLKQVEGAEARSSARSSARSRASARRRSRSSTLSHALRRRPSTRTTTRTTTARRTPSATCTRTRRRWRRTSSSPSTERDI